MQSSIAYQHAPSGSPLRYYQEEAVDSIFGGWESARSMLAVMATGTGKTRVGAEVVARFEGRVLWLAHREELCLQAREAIERRTGEYVGLEKAEHRSTLERIVVGSVQSVYRRMDKIGDYDLIVFDEAHHCVSKTYRAPFERWPNAKILGLTATPDRSDEQALGQIFDEVAYVFDIQDGIESGFLVPILGTEVFNRQLDISSVDVTAGDLQAGQLDEAMLKAAEGIVNDVLNHCPTQQTIIFTPGVKTAHLIAERICALRPDHPNIAMSADGKTDPDERRRILELYKKGVTQYLVNCQLYTEGFDAPNTQAVVLARPTKSRALYVQMVGRGTRPLPDTLRGLPLDSDGAEARKSAIAASGKPHVHIVDIVGNCGRHSLVSLVDALGGKFTAAEVERAKKNKKAGQNPLEALREAREAIARAARSVTSKYTSQHRTFNPFDVLKVRRDDDYIRMRFGYKPATQKQREALERLGIQAPDDLSIREASRILDKNAKRMRAGLASIKQLKLLSKFGVSNPNLSFSVASDAISYIASTDWGRSSSFNITRLQEILSRRREAGEHA